LRPENYEPEKNKKIGFIMDYAAVPGFPAFHSRMGAVPVLGYALLCELRLTGDGAA